MSDASNVWEEMSRELAEALVAAAGDEGRERAAIARALARYARARLPHDEPPFEYAVHFLANDGVALDTKVQAAFQRPRADQATFARWVKILTGLPEKLDVLDELAGAATR